MTKAEAMQKANELNFGNIVSSPELRFVFVAVKTRVLGKVSWMVQKFGVEGNKATLIDYVE